MKTQARVGYINNSYKSISKRQTSKLRGHKGLHRQGISDQREKVRQFLPGSHPGTENEDSIVSERFCHPFTAKIWFYLLLTTISQSLHLTLLTMGERQWSLPPAGPAGPRGMDPEPSGPGQHQPGQSQPPNLTTNTPSSPQNCAGFQILQKVIQMNVFTEQTGTPSVCQVLF